MIVVSGVLVLVALIFLIIGLFGDGLGFIWASIVTSVVAGVFLLLGALQRRGTPAAATDTGVSEGDTLERVTAVSVRPRDEGAEAGTDEAAGEPAAASGEVAVVRGRPRYHTESCRFLAGRPDIETISLEAARSEGFTACGVCKPDQAVAAAAAASTEPPAAEQAASDDTAAMDTSDLDTADLASVAPPSRAARKAPAKKAAAVTKSTATRATRGSAATADTGDGAADTATAATTTATKAAKATKAAAKPAAGAATVVAVPDRGKFHTETCRFASAPGALSMSKTAAKRQGLAPCGVCKP